MDVREYRRSPHAVRFSQAIGVCVRKTFPVHCLKWADVGREYIEVVKGDLQEQSRTNKAARQKQAYNHSSGRGKPVDRVELFRETHVRAGTFVSQAAEDAHNQMLELQSQPTLEGSQPLSEDEICDQGPKPKACRPASASSSSTSCSQSTEKEIELQAKLHEALERIEVQDRNHQALASQVEAMKKMIEELTRAQQGPPHDP
uniref:CACTA en-spm transposon protein n=1 Tax=Cucumis melo TaxID=3656 RepID=A0A9I9ELP9_CUCME